MLVYAQDPGSSWGRLLGNEGFERHCGGRVRLVSFSSTPVPVSSPHLYRAAVSAEEGALPVQHIVWASGLTQLPLITVELKIHEHPYMKTFCPSQHTEVLADREYSLSGTA